MESPITPTTSLRLERRFEAPRRRVFEAWTRPEALKSWFCHPGFVTLEAVVDARPGGRYLIRVAKEGGGEPFHVEGIYREVLPPEKLVFTWKWSHAPEVKETVVTVVLTEEGKGTRLTLVHELFESEALRDEHTTGWDLVLQGLTGYLA